MHDIHLLLQPQVKPPPVSHSHNHITDSPHTQGRGRRALLFATLDTFLIVWSCRLKGFANTRLKVSTVPCKWGLRKVEMGVYGNTFQVKKNVLLE